MAAKAALPTSVTTIHNVNTSNFMSFSLQKPEYLVVGQIDLEQVQARLQLCQVPNSHARYVQQRHQTHVVVTASTFDDISAQLHGPGCVAVLLVEVPNYSAPYQDDKNTQSTLRTQEHKATNGVKLSRSLALDAVNVLAGLQPTGPTSTKDPGASNLLR
ncbi:unnamed protein product [Phytophthora fragariaefolia]|uniref:Unnamed protein product n=1 Tax=Phytophthora fragariaefolia TaxID=1490495 RepID=A0A9W6X215_9STRA|nr:unnamed protein product [Phytophthora fragariaefolia]